MSDQTRDLPFGIDFGGSGIKGAPVDLEAGDFAAERVRIKTPKPSTPEAVAGVFAELLASFDDSTGSVGVTVPAVVRHGVVSSAANIDASWIGTDADALFTKATGRDVHVVNDADAAGLAEVQVRRGDGPRWPGHRDHAGHGHRVGDPVRRRAGAELRARPPRDRRARRRGPRRQLGQGAGGAVLPGVGAAAHGLLPDAGEAVLPRPVRGRGRGQQGRRRVHAPDRHRDRDRAGQAARTGPGSSGAALWAAEAGDEH